MAVQPKFLNLYRTFASMHIQVVHTYNKIIQECLFGKQMFWETVYSKCSILILLFVLFSKEIVWTDSNWSPCVNVIINFMFKNYLNMAVQPKFLNLYRTFASMHIQVVHTYNKIIQECLFGKQILHVEICSNFQHNICRHLI
jgi:hypothetical protein